MVPSAPAATLRFHDVVKTYGTRTVVDRVSLAVGAGEIVALVGVNGSGKSTLFRIASGFVRATSGSVAIETPGKCFSLLDRPASDRVGLGLCSIAQERLRMHALSTLDCLRIARSAGTGSAHDADIFEALASLGLSHLLEKRPSAMTQPDAVRLLLAQAYVVDPRFLIIDEPFAGLDGREVAECTAIVRALRVRGTGILITDHHPAAILAAADRVHIIQDGAILYSDTVEAARTSVDAALLYFRKRA